MKQLSFSQIWRTGIEYSSYPLYLEQTNKCYQPLLTVLMEFSKRKRLMFTIFYYHFRVFTSLVDVSSFENFFHLATKQNLVCSNIQHGAQQSGMMYSERGDGDTKKLSFLLGAALRNGDEDQFLTLYDAALPANLPKEKVQTKQIRK